MPAIDSYYHPGYLAALQNRVKSISPKEEENITTQVLLEAIALAELVAYIGDNAKQTVLNMSDLSKLTRLDLSNQELMFSSGLIPLG